MITNKFPALMRVSLIRDFGLKRYRSKKEFINYLAQHDHSITERTLNRDFEFLRTLGFEVNYDAQNRKFAINDSYVDKENLFDRALKQDYLNKFKNSFKEKYRKYVIDQESPSEDLILVKLVFKAIEEQFSIQFDYQKYNKPLETRAIYPLQIKVSQNRWYVIGYDFNKEVLRIFGLDRIKTPFLGERFNTNNIPDSIFKKLDLHKFYLGVSKYILPNEKKILIKLGVTDFLIEYWKTRPIHFTQKVTDQKKGLLTIVEFTLVPNIDLVKLIVSSLGEIKILEPLYLKELIEKDYTNEILKSLD